MHRRPRFTSLAEYLARSGATQADLARLCGTSQANISRIARGHAVPRPKLAARLARTARVPLDSFAKAAIKRDEATT